MSPPARPAQPVNIASTAPIQHYARRLTYDKFIRYRRKADTAWSRFERSGRLVDVDSAITFQRAALDSCSHGNTDRAEALHSLAYFLVERYKRWGEASHLDEAITLYRVALELQPDGHPGRSMSLNNIANSLLTRFERAGSMDDLEEAIILHRAALELRPDGHPDRPISLNNIANSLLTRFEQAGSMDDLEESTRLYRAALEYLPDGHPGRSTSLSNIASSLWTRFRHVGGMGDLEESIILYRAALELRPDGHPDRSMSLNNIASALLTRFEQTGSVGDLDESIILYRAALELRPDGHPRRSMSLNNIANSLLTRFGRVGTTDDLEESIRLHRAALELQPDGHPDRSMSLNNIATSLLTRFEQAGSMDDLEESIRSDRAALELQPDGHPDRSTSLNNIASSLLIRFRQAGNMDDLEESIRLDRAALELQPDGHPHRSVSLNNIASSLLTRFEQAGSKGDLEESIRLYRAALELRPDGHPLRSTSLNNIANSLLTRFERAGSMGDLQESIRLYRSALELLPEGHLDRSMSLNNIANCLSTRFRQAGSMDDLEESIRLHRAALELRPDGHPLRSTTLHNIANSLLRRFEQAGSMDDLEESIRLHRSALELRPDGHPGRSATLNNMADSLLTLFEQGGKMGVLEESIRSLRDSTAHSYSSFSSRLEGAQRWIRLARRHDRQSLSEAYSTGISLLQQALAIRHTLSAQHEFLSAGHYQSLALDAASFAIEKGDFPGAIELLEQGRALLWSQLRGFRSPLEQISRSNKALGEDFAGCSRRLEALIVSSGSVRTGARTHEIRTSVSGASHGVKLFDEKLVRMRQLYKKREALIDDIRRMPGFENFLRSAPYEVIQQAASEGPVVVLNYSKYRCDALIVLSQETNRCICVPLDTDFYNDIARLHEKLVQVRRGLQVSPLEYDDILRQAMKALWDRVVFKVVEKLKEVGFTERSRIWWCATSVLSAFPFHAAGPYEDSNGKTKYLLDDYISSYTPTLTSLINARSGLPINAQSGGERMLFVADTKLPSAKKERASIMRIRRFRQLVDDHATPEAVLEMLRKAQWVHFVCHGQLHKEPFKSSLRLPGGKLTLLDIARANLPNAEFAFLSACHTAEQGPKYALDEALHLAAAMQFCGFRSVVGTMWQLLDWDGPLLAYNVYGYLMRDLQGGEIRFKRGAAAVREAALRLREHGDPDPKTGKLMTERWVNLVHIGA